MADVFISYSRKDKDFVRHLHDALAKVNRDTWVDWEGIPPTAEWLKEVYSGIESANTFVFVISPDSVASQVCAEEIAHAVKHNKRLVPIMCRDIDAKAVPQSLSLLNWIFFRENDNFDSAFQTLIKAMDTDLDYVHDHTRLLIRAIEWDGNKRDNSFVLRGSDLKEAEQWLIQGAVEEPKPTPLQTQYIIASRKTETRRLRLTRGGVLVALVVSIALGLFGWIQRSQAIKQAKTALSRQLAAQALPHLDDQLDLALLLGVEAYRTHDTFEARSILLTGLEHQPHLAAFLRGHTSAVYSMAFSSDGKILASGSQDNTIILWDVANRQLLSSPLKGHEAAVYSVAFSPNGKTLASGSTGGTIILWDVATRQRFSPLPQGHTYEVNGLAFSPDDTTLASGSPDSLILWNVAKHEIITKHPIHVNSLAFSPDGKTLALAEGWGSGAQRLGFITLMDVVTGEFTRLSGSHHDDVESVAFSPDGKILASGSADGTIVLWNVNTRQPISKPFTGDPNFRTKSGSEGDVPFGKITSVVFSPDGKNLLCGSDYGTVSMWDVTTLERIEKPLRVHRQSVQSIVFSKDGQTFASAGADGIVLLWKWSIDTRQRIGVPLQAYKAAVQSVAFSANGQTLLSSGTDKTIVLWNVATGKPLGPPINSHKDSLLSVTFSPDSRMLALGSSDDNILRWDVTTDQSLGRPLPLKDHKGTLLSVAFSPDGKMLASSSRSEYVTENRESFITLWQLATSQPLGPSIKGNTFGVYSMAFGPNSEKLAFGGCGALDRRYRDKHCAQGEIKVWDIRARQLLSQPLIGHEATVSTVAFSPDGQTLASGSEDGIILWDVTTGRALGPLLKHTAAVEGVAFSPDGKSLALGGGDGTIMLWDVSFESWKARACSIANRNLTCEEWKRYLPDEPYRKICPNLPLPADVTNCKLEDQPF